MLNRIEKERPSFFFSREKEYIEKPKDRFTLLRNRPSILENSIRDTVSSRSPREKGDINKPKPLLFKRRLESLEKTPITPFLFNRTSPRSNKFEGINRMNPLVSSV